MTSPDILITLCTHASSIVQPLSDYLTHHHYRFRHENNASHQIWIPLIAPLSPIDSLRKFYDTFETHDFATIPILLEGVPCPDWLSTCYKIEIADTSSDWQPHFDRLRDYLSKVTQLTDKRASLKAEYESLHVHQAIDTSRLNHYMADLESRIEFIKQLIRYPLRVQEKNQETILTGLQKLRDKPAYPFFAEHDHPQTVGNPPQGRSSAFKGRETELASISNYVLHNTDTRLISILGQGGVGKTALACHALDNLAKHDSIYSVMYLSAEDRNHSFTLEQIFILTGEIFGDEVREMLDRVWKNDQMPLETRIDYLIDQYVDERCLLLFDNLEDQLTDQGRFIDEELSHFFDQFLIRHHQATILMTSRVPVHLSDFHLPISKVIPLSSGLSTDYAIELLPELDKDGTLGFCDASVDTLTMIVNLTQGFPRALEAVVGILANRPLMPFDDLADIAIRQDNLIADWVNYAEDCLDADQRMVMQALAVFARPISETAIHFLLDPYVEVTGIDVDLTLRRLQYGRYITRNHSTGDISIHPLDKAYNYNTLIAGEANRGLMSAGERFLRQMNILPPVEETPDEQLFTRFTLEKRAGDYYAQLRGQPDDWETIHDLQPYFLEYEHRLRATDYETSFTMLITIYNLLKLSGFSRKIVEMINPLIQYLGDTYLMTCYNMLGMAYDDLGRYQEALTCHLTALPLARHESNRPAEAAHLSGIGLQYSNLGKYDKALEHYDLALEISREQGRRKQERGILNNMAVVYNSIGRKLEGLAYYEESLEIARDINDRQGIAVTLANIGDSYGALGNVEKTIECYQEAIEIYTDIGDKLGRGVTIGKMGNAAIMLGSYDDALSLLSVAIGIAQAVGNRMWEVLHQADIATVYAHQGDVEQGVELLEQMIPKAREVGSPILINYTHSLLAGVLLYAGDFERAAEASQMAIRYVNPANQHYEYALYGLILVRLKQVKAAKEAFTTALDHAAELLENTPDLYSPKYSRGLALMGLAVVTGDTTYAEDAKDAYIDARENCSAKGIVNREMKKLKLLTGTDDSNDNTPLRFDALDE